MQERYYFDHNATTAPSDEVREAMTAALRDDFGNASSIHHYGQAAKQSLETARREVAAMLGASEKEIVFLSGGTEANNLAILGVALPGDHVITSAIEHPAVLNPCARLAELGVAMTILPPNAAGRVDPDDVRRALRPETRLVSIMHANNETGVIQPVEEIARVTREAGALLHVDGVQAAGKIPVDLPSLGADMYSISGHKFHGPKGTGALFVRQGVKLKPLLLGGRQERERRAGTENVPGAVALGCAARWVRQHGAAEAERLRALRDRLEEGILASVPDVSVNGDRRQRIPNTTSLRFDGIDGEAVVIALDLRGFAVSTGSACSSGAVESSHVLLAMGLAACEARSSVRFSLGRPNTVEQVDALVEAVAGAASHLRRVSATYSHAR
jgi:cysteine desulfurase